MKALSTEQAEAIQEIINIGFGRAASAVAQILCARLELSVPFVATVESDSVVEFLRQHFQNQDPVSLVQQSFYGNFMGEAALILPKGSSQVLVEMLSSDMGYVPELDADKLEQEVLLEIGNLVIGASLGQFAALLQTRVAFKPPHVAQEMLCSDDFQRRVSQVKGGALLVRTSFRIKEKMVSGYLFFFLSAQCLEWLIQAVDKFLEEQT